MDNLISSAVALLKSFNVDAEKEFSMINVWMKAMPTWLIFQ